MTDVDPKSPEALTHDLGQLAAYGIGCPRAITLGGPGKVRDWIEEQFSRLEVERQADASEERLAAQMARTDPETGDVGESTGEFLDRKLAEDHDTEPEYADASEQPATLGDVAAIEDRLATMAAARVDVALGELEGRIGGRLEAMERALEALQEKKGTKKE